jgi:2TM domain-containing protein
MTVPSDQDLRAKAEARVKAREDFRVHLLIYVLVNAMLWVVWLLGGADIRNPWPIYSLLGWGIGIVAHWYSVYGMSNRNREAEIEAEMRRLRGDDTGDRAR